MSDIDGVVVLVFSLRRQLFWVVVDGNFWKVGVDKTIGWIICRQGQGMEVQWTIICHG